MNRSKWLEKGLSMFQTERTLKGLQVKESLTHFGELKYVHHVWNIKNKPEKWLGPGHVPAWGMWTVS